MLSTRTSRVQRIQIFPLFLLTSTKKYLSVKNRSSKPTHSFRYEGLLSMQNFCEVKMDKKNTDTLLKFNRSLSQNFPSNIDPLQYSIPPPMMIVNLSSCRSGTTAPIDYRPQSLLPVSILEVFAVIHETHRYRPSTITDSGAATDLLNLDYAQLLLLQESASDYLAVLINQLASWLSQKLQL